ncbi:MAG: biotin--[acetyl-CoA-carboxylase] ligase [Planctomycetota bacterium]|jgi:BirA family biotin operon repressor/biotin-[acetyl-CoA-carboxylase] ligase
MSDTGNEWNAARKSIAGHPLVRLAETDSTNAHARRLLEDGRLPDGAVVLADRQTAGRGRQGRGWVTVPGRSLAASIVLAPPPLARPSRLTVLAAVAACRALDYLGAPDVFIKWPNDLMRADRKLGGLLVERVQQGDGPPRYVLGIGINLELHPGDLPPGLEASAIDTGLGVDHELREKLLAALLVELDAALAELGGPGDARRGAEYQERSWLRGRQVELKVGGERLTTRIEEVSPDGDLRLPDGRLLAGETVELAAVEGLPRAR